MKNTDVVILSAARTAVGSFGGTLASVHPADMGAAAVKEALKRGNVDPAQVDEVLLGCVLQAGLGQNIARQVSLKAGIALEVPTTTVNKVCGSGLKTVNMAAQAILAGDAEIIVAGGVESMSMAPYLLPNARYGYRMGDGKTIDAMVHDGLWCAFNQYHMGITAENVAEKWGISREEQDKFAVSSQNKAEKAILENRFADEIIPFEIQSKKGTTIFDTDEFVKKGVTFEQLSKLKPAFKKDGTVTAGNASGINDGAAAIIVTTAKKAEELGVKPLARYVAQASAGLDPAIMGVGPIYATRKVLQKTGWTISDLDLIEANEAFAAQSCAVAKDLEFDMSKVNVNGGAIAIGHPIGASGARIFITLLYEMQKRDATKGLATLCIGGGQGISTLVER